MKRTRFVMIYRAEPIDLTNSSHHAKVHAMAFPLSLEPGSPLRSHASSRVLREAHLAVTNRHYVVTNDAARSSPRSIERDAVPRLSHGDNVARVGWIVFKLSPQLG